jgi:hypothetical protein
MNSRADAAEALSEQPSLSGIASFENFFDSPPHRAGGPSIGHSIIVYFNIHAKMPFDASDRINRDSFCHRFSPCASSSINLLL